MMPASFRTQVRNRPTPDCVPIPQGKGREGKGREGKGWLRIASTLTVRASRPVDNSPAEPCPAMRCEEDRIVHSRGVANPRWPLCHEAVARAELGWSDGEIADGELSCCWDLLVAGIDTDRAATCDACREWAHA